MSHFENEPVLLGIEDARIAPELDRLCSASVSKFGGVANWPSSLPVSPLDAAEVQSAFTCPSCGLVRALIVQIHAPIGDSPLQRTLYVIACVRGECVRMARGWACFRIQYRDSNATHRQVQQLNNSNTTDWTDDADDWSDDDDATVTSLPESMVGVCIESCEDCNQQDSVSNSHVSNKWAPEFSHEIETTGAGFVPYYLSVVEEPIPQTTTQPMNGESTHITTQVPVSGDIHTEAACDQEHYESALPAHGDRLFYKLQQRLGRCPNQLLRYSRDNIRQPALLLQPLVPPCDARCRYCGARLVFELQVMSTLVSRLRPLFTASSADAEVPGFGAAEVPEFGTVLVFTCADSCWSENDLSLRREEVVVQLENL